MRTFVPSPKDRGSAWRPSKKVTYKITDNGVYFNTIYDITLTTFKTVPEGLTKYPQKEVKFMLKTLEMTPVFEYASVIFELPDRYLLMVKINSYEIVEEGINLEFLLTLSDKYDSIARIIQPIGSRDKHIFEFPQTDQWGMETTERCTLQRTWSIYAYDLTIANEYRQGNVRNLAEYLFKRYAHGPV